MCALFEFLLDCWEENSAVSFRVSNRYLPMSVIWRRFADIFSLLEFLGFGVEVC